MSKITFVIPLYNKKEYFRKCMDSILASEKKEIPIVIINDGSTDGSEELAKQYQKQNKNIRIFNNKNMGLSYSRNFGISKVNTEYFLLVDSDDYIDNNLLTILEKTIVEESSPDLVSFRIKKVDESGNELLEIKKPAIGSSGGEEALEKFILSNESFELAPGFLYKKSFFVENNFEYSLGRYHEDFGLTPWIVLNAKKIVSIDFVGYYYVQSKNSIMRENNYLKEKKKAYDTLYLFDNLLNKIKNSNFNNKAKDLFVIYISHTLLTKICKLNKNDQRKFVQEIRKRKLYMILPNSGLKKIIKNILIFINPKYYFMVVK